MIVATGARVVLSSAWRLTEKSREKVKAAFLLHGVPLPISCTPRIKYAKGWKYSRVHEILAWLQINTTIEFNTVDIIQENLTFVKGRFDIKDFRLPVKINVSHFVALDDIDMRLHGCALIADKHFVLTFMCTGVTEQNLKQAQHILSDDYDEIDMTTPLGVCSEGRLLLPCSKSCESVDCCQQAPTVYDNTVNKYFCGVKCRDRFYDTHFAETNPLSFKQIDNLS
jgi:hypothetical protein